ncbi:MAG: thioredoxin family protein [Gammaproteobacteria bacterium]|nr:thioredoxin family protein [Gammaproteobacteria bacterium]
MTRTLINILALVIFGLSSAQAVETSRNPDQHFFQESFWDFSEELEMAREEGKKGIVIFFELTECPFCHWMKQNVLNQVSVQNYYRENFRVFRLDIEGDVEMVDFQGNTTTMKAFANKARVRATPVIGFFDLEGNMVQRYTGKTADPQEFIWLAEFVVAEKYKETKFTRYKRERRRETRRK